MTTEPPTVTRMAPGEAQDGEALQGWALSGAAETGARDVDLLFVHGMASGGWMWSQPWLDHFAKAGYRTWTITLPGRQGGGTFATDPGALDRAFAMAMQDGDADRALEALFRAVPGAQLLDGPGLGDFADAIEDSLRRIGRPTAVIAHSLGGAAVQRLMQRGQRPAATVLMASVPPYGLWRASLEMAIVNPDLYRALFDFSLAGINAQNVDVMRAAFFPSGIADAEFNALVPQLTDESLRAMTEAMGFLPFAPFPAPRPDLLVLGGTKDRFVPLVDIWATALYYGTRPTILEGAGHLMMQEPGYADQAAREILNFLDAI